MIQNTGMEIGAKIEKIPILVKFIGNSMLKFGLGEYQQLQVQLAVEEAVKNVINHGNLKQSDKITIKCQKNDSLIKIIIEDPGTPFNPIEVSQQDSKISPLKKGSDSLGVYFIKKNMNKVNYDFHGGKNILTLIKSI